MGILVTNYNAALISKTLTPALSQREREQVDL